MNSSVSSRTRFVAGDCLSERYDVGRLRKLRARLAGLNEAFLVDVSLHFDRVHYSPG